MAYNPRFTTDPRRIARLVANAEEGMLRESLPQQEREQLDRQALEVSPAKLAFLFDNAANRARSIRQARAADAEAASLAVQKK